MVTVTLLVMTSTTTTVRSVLEVIVDWTVMTIINAVKSVLERDAPNSHAHPVSVFRSVYQEAVKWNAYLQKFVVKFAEEEIVP